MKRKIILAAEIILIFLGIIIISVKIISNNTKTDHVDESDQSESQNFESDSGSMNGTTEFTIDTSVENKEMSERKTFSADEQIDVVLIGNSLMMSNNMYDNLKYMSEVYSYNFEMHTLCGYEATISDSLAKLSNEKLAEMMRDAEVVVFQEYGHADDTTYEDIYKILEYCSEDVEAYYYTTVFDFDEVLIEKIAEDERIHLVPSNALIQYVTRYGYFTSDDLTVEGDFHPNETDGYLVSLILFAEITGEKCVDYPNKYTNDRLMMCMPGDNVGAQIKAFNDIYSKADDMISVYEVSWRNIMW